MAEDSDRDKILREILVAVDTSPHSHAALEAAVTLAHILGANVQGLFVENELWGRLSDVPSTFVVNELTGEKGRYERDTVEEKMALLRNRLRDRMHDLGQHYQVAYSMEVVRGRVEEKVLEASERSDLVTLGLKGNYAKRGRLGSTARAIIRQSDKPVLILEKGMYIGTIITVVYDGSEESRKGLDIAVDIVRQENSKLSVLVTEGENRPGNEIAGEVREILNDSRVFANVEPMPARDLGGFLDRIYKQRCGLVIVPKSQALARTHLETILINVQCPVLLVS